MHFGPWISDAFEKLEHWERWELCGYDGSRLGVGCKRSSAFGSYHILASITYILERSWFEKKRKTEKRRKKKRKKSCFDRYKYK